MEGGDCPAEFFELRIVGVDGQGAGDEIAGVGEILFLEVCVSEIVQSGEVVWFEFEHFVGEVDALIEQVGIVVAEAEVLVRAGVFGVHVDGLFEAAHRFGVAADLGKQAAEVEEDIGLVGGEF